MSPNLVIHELDGTYKKVGTRDVYWVHTPEITGGKYSSVCTSFYEPGTRGLPAHLHEHGEETIYVISGMGKAKIGDTVFELKPGSVALFPEGVPHTVWNTGKEKLHLVCFYAPSIKAIQNTAVEDFDFPEFQK